MKDTKRIYQMLGMAARARMIITGEELVVREVRNPAMRISSLFQKMHLTIP